MDQFVPRHLSAFVRLGLPFMQQPPFNLQSPRQWANEVLREDRESLPGHALDRAAVRSLCLSASDVLDGYLAVMAWGMQGLGNRRSGAVRAWSHSSKIRGLLERLVQDAPTRADAYDLFAGEVPGLGPAYFTKLLYFFGPWPEHGPRNYIMDQWTGKAMNLLTGRRIPSLTSGRHSYVASGNTGADYEDFCAKVDALAAHLCGLGPDTQYQGYEVEQMLFSVGTMREGGRRTPPAPWRAYVRANFTMPPHHPATPVAATASGDVLGGSKGS